MGQSDVIEPYDRPVARNIERKVECRSHYANGRLNAQSCERLYDLGEEGVGDLGRDQAKTTTVTANQRAGVGIRIVPNYLPNASGQNGVD